MDVVPGGDRSCAQPFDIHILQVSSRPALPQERIRTAPAAMNILIEDISVPAVPVGVTQQPCENATILQTQTAPPHAHCLRPSE
jgi:hypothetical protein